MNIRESKAVAWGAMILIVLVVIFTISMKYVESIWDYTTIFCAFMAVFCHLMALSLIRMSRNASRKLDIAAICFAGLAVAFLIVVFILYMVAM